MEITRKQMPDRGFINVEFSYSGGWVVFRPGGQILFRGEQDEAIDHARALLREDDGGFICLLDGVHMRDGQKRIIEEIAVPKDGKIGERRDYTFRLTIESERASGDREPQVVLDWHEARPKKTRFFVTRHFLELSLPAVRELACLLRRGIEVAAKEEKLRESVFLDVLGDWEITVYVSREAIILSAGIVIDGVVDFVECALLGATEASELAEGLEAAVERLKTPVTSLATY